MTRLADTLLEVNDLPVKALMVLGANPVASNPDQRRIRQALEREDLFTVVVDHFQTDTADYADLLLPTRMQPEHADIQNAYGHLYLMWNEPAVQAPGECLPSTEIFRRLARAMGLTDPCLYESDEELARALLDTEHASVRGITLQRLKDAAVEISDVVQPGLAMSPKGYWPKLTAARLNANATVDERDSDMGRGAVFHDNRVEVEAAEASRAA